MLDFLVNWYPWVKAFHIMSVLAWMAGLFYLPRLFVHHVERAEAIAGAGPLFVMMEEKLLRLIMNPSMIATWVFGLLLVATPGVVDWGAGWSWVKAAMVLGMTWFHMWLAARRKELMNGRNTRSGRSFRIMNEVPTLFMVVIVIMVVVKPF